MRGRTLQRSMSVALLLAAAPWWLGCATEIHLRQAPAGALAVTGGRVQVRVFEDRSARRRDTVTAKDVVTELYRLDGTAERLVREGKEPRWSAEDLEPGPYVLRATRCVDEWGVVRKEFVPREARLSVRPRQTTFADVVLRDPGEVWLKVLAGIVLTYVYVEDLKEKGYLQGVRW